MKTEEVLKYKILLVDDNKNYLKALRFQINDVMASQIEYMDEAYNGIEAIEKINQKMYHYVFMDFAMPKMNGVETAEYISEKYPQTVIIALSMFSEFEYIDKMLSAGSRLYIEKDKLDDETIKNIFEKLNYSSINY